MFKHQLLLKSLLLAVLLTFGILASVYFGLFELVILSDISLISLAIFVIFVIIFSLMCYRSYKISSQMNKSMDVCTFIKENIKTNSKFEYIDGIVTLDGIKLDQCSVTDYIKCLVITSKNSKGKFDRTILLDEYSTNLYNTINIGILTSKKMTNLGLFGTVVGFSIALYALFGISTIDINTMKVILSDVAVGMSIALYTTITALAGTVPLDLQIFFLEQGISDLISETAKVTEMYVIPALETQYETNTITCT